jgi:hypothetical protein
MLPATPIIFRVVGNNMENCSNFSSCMFFRVVAHNADNFSIVVVAYNAEQSSALLATT